MTKNCDGNDVSQIDVADLSQIIGQPQVTDQLQAYLRAHFNIKSTRGDSNLAFGPVMLCGPSGTGKTLVAKGIHQPNLD